MTISGNVPQHLVVAARTGFLSAVNSATLPWQQIAGVINLAAQSQTLVDLGAAPMPVEELQEKQSFIEKSLTVKAKNWSLIVGISHNAVMDDQTGTLNTKVRSAGENFQRAINNLVFKALDAGDGTTYGACYDGLSFFNDSHVDKGAAYQTTQDNNFALALSLDNFTTNYALGNLFKDDQGEYVEHNFDMIVTSPTLRPLAAQIVGNPQSYDTSSRENNPFYGTVNKLIISPYMNTTAYVCIASGETAKPMYVVMREQPGLQDAWFDPIGPDGGMYNFKFYGRYNVCYGDWRLAWLGNS